MRSSTAGSSLAAQTPEVAPAGLRNRRGSGSGLALMRSLSSSAASAGQARQPAPGEGARQDQAHQASSQQLAELEARSDLRAAFCVFDLDGDGYITLDEVRAGLKLLGESWSPAEVDQLFSRCAGAPARRQARHQAAGARADLNKQRISIDDFVRLLL